MPTASERELKIELDILQPGSFRAKFSYDDPDSAASGGSVSSTVTLPKDLDSLDKFDEDDDSQSPYGNALSKALFADEAVRKFYNTAIGAAAASALRIRIYCSANALELHNLKWELLGDPETGELFSTSEKTPFSRFVSTGDWKTVHLTPQRQLKALIAVANPTDIAANDLKPIDVRLQLATVWMSLAGAAKPTKLEPDIADVPLPELAAKLREKYGFGSMAGIVTLGDREPASLDNILTELSRGVDIFYLVCHGTNEVKPDLFLQDDKGKTAQTDGLNVANKFRAMKSPPRLVVLASCESAGRAGKSAETAIAPLLADAGVPAIIAMQGKVSITTIGRMMPEFFRNLVSEGNIAQAMAAARGKAIGKCPDAWMPALFLRLKAGSLWYKPGFGGTDDDDNVAWDSICQAVRSEALFPIIGHDLAEHILGSSSAVAADLADQNGIPRPQSQKPDPARIAQSLETKVARNTLFTKLDAVNFSHLLAAAKRLDPTLNEVAKNEEYAAQRLLPNLGPTDVEQELLSKVAEILKRNEQDPLSILANLRVKVFAYAASDLLLNNLLRKLGKTPYEMCVDWRDETVNDFARVKSAAETLLKDFEASSDDTPTGEIIKAWEVRIVTAENRNEIPISLRTIRDALLDRLRDSPFPRIDEVRKWQKLYVDPPGDTKPSPWSTKTPIIYYAYGKKSYADSLVLTEDDFFDYLIRQSKFELMPAMIASSLLTGSVLFLGFSLDDWKFRILFRTIMQKGGASLLKPKVDANGNVERQNYKHVGVQLDPDDYSPGDAIRVKRLLQKYFQGANIDIYWGSSADFLRELQRRLDNKT